MFLSLIHILDPLGDLYKCWNDVSRKEFRVGNVYTGVEYNTALSKYLNYEAAVSYTHLDVYKRQEQKERGVDLVMSRMTMILSIAFFVIAILLRMN